MLHASHAFMLGVGVVAAASCPSIKAIAQAEWQQCGGINWTGGTTCATGLTCVVQNPYYSQCLASSGVIASSADTSTPTTAVSHSTLVPPKQPATSLSSSIVSIPSPPIIVPPLQPVSSSPASPAPSSSSSSGSGTVYKSSFTHYGAGDTFGSPNCNTNTAACGYYTFPGFSAAASQNV
jgi:hypothetical protein